MDSQTADSILTVKFYESATMVMKLYLLLLFRDIWQQENYGIFKVPHKQPNFYFITFY